MSFTATQIGEVKTELLTITESGLVNITSYSDSITGSNSSRYFNKEFRLSQDGILFTNYYTLNNENLSKFNFCSEVKFFIEIRYTRAGSDNTGNLTFNSLTLTVAVNVDSCLVGDFAVKNPIFKDIFCNNLIVNEISLNLFDKIKQRGILPDYIERNDSEIVDYDKDFDEFWMNICEFFAMLNTHCLYISNVLSNRDLLIKFLTNKGLILQGDEDSQTLISIAQKRFELFYRRGTDLIFRDKNEVLRDGSLNDLRGEFLNLISKKDTDEFIVNYVQQKHQGWCIGNSSPLYKGISDDQLLLNKFYKDDFESDNSSIPTIAATNSTVTYEVDSTRDNKTVMNIKEGLTSDFSGIAVIKAAAGNKKILIDPKLNYELVFWFKTIGSVPMYFGIDCYDEDLNLINTESVFDGSDRNAFILPEEALFDNSDWRYMRGIIHPVNQINQPEPDCNTSYNVGFHLRFKPEAKYIIPKIGVGFGDIVNVNLYISDVRFKMSYLPWSLGVLNMKNLVYMFIKNNPKLT